MNSSKRLQERIRSLFGQPETPPGHDDFGQILDTDGFVACWVTVPRTQSGELPIPAAHAGKNEQEKLIKLGRAMHYDIEREGALTPRGSGIHTSVSSSAAI